MAEILRLKIFWSSTFWNWRPKTNGISNKKVLLRERKRHTACHMAGAHYAALYNGGGVPHPVLAWGGVTPSSPGWQGERVPHPVSWPEGTPSSPGQGGGYPIQSWLGGGTPSSPGCSTPSIPGQGVPHPVSWPGGTPSSPGEGGTPSSPGWGYSPTPSRPGMGYPLIQTWDGVPSIQTWNGYPPPHIEVWTDTQNENILRMRAVITKIFFCGCLACQPKYPGIKIRQILSPFIYYGEYFKVFLLFNWCNSFRRGNACKCSTAWVVLSNAQVYLPLQKSSWLRETLQHYTSSESDAERSIKTPTTCRQKLVTIRSRVKSTGKKISRISHILSWIKQGIIRGRNRHCLLAF